VIYLSAADTDAILDWPAAIDCMRKAYSAEANNRAVPGRLVAADKSAWIRCMPAIPGTGRFMGTKQISRTRDGKVVYVITLFDKATGELAYLMDGISITAMRTAATSALGLDALSAPGPIGKLAVLGSGLEARSHVRAIAAARPVQSLAVFSPTAASREAFAESVRADLRIDAEAVSSPDQAVSGATHVLAAARSRDESPILYGNWLAPGATIVSIGSTTASQREVDASVVERASVIVADEVKELSHDTGDMIAAREKGVSFEHKLFSLYDLVQNRIPYRRAASDIAMFKSVGSALQDIAFAEFAAEACAARSLGQPIPVALKVKQSIGKNS